MRSLSSSRFEVMTGSAAGSHDALGSEFREALGRFAEQARKERERAAEEVCTRPEPKPISWWVPVGLLLIAAQSFLALCLYTQQSAMVGASRNLSMILPEHDCRSVVYQTYWKVVAYLRDHDHPPPRLEDLLGGYLETLPVHPATGRPLAYSTDGKRFELGCPNPVSSKAGPAPRSRSSASSLELPERPVPLRPLDRL